MMETTQRSTRIENLRAIAILTVVFGHSIILYSNSWNLYLSASQAPLFDFIKQIINYYQMPLYFAVSGYLFAYRAPSHGFLKFIQKKAKRLLIPFLAIGICFMIPLKLLVAYPPYQGKSFFAAVLLLLKGVDTGHLWFLPTLTCIFLVAYVMVMLFGNHLNMWIITTILGFLSNQFYYVVPTLFPAVQYIRWTLEFFWSFSFGAVLYHIMTSPFFLQSRVKLLACGSVTAAVLIILKHVICLPIPSIAISVLLVLILFLAASAKRSNFMHSISENSFGIYLIHSPLIYITFTYCLNANPLIVVSINFFLFGGLAYLISYTIGKSKIKIIIGG